MIPPFIFTPARILFCTLLAWTMCVYAWADRATFLAVTVDGEKFEGRRIANWHRGDFKFSLNEEDVGGGSDLQFYRNRSLPVVPSRLNSAGALEFFNADRVVGEVVAFRDATAAGDDKTPAHLFVDTPTGFANPDSKHSGPLRVKLDLLRRISWRGEIRHPYTPSVLFTHDGRKLAYRNLKWTNNSVRLLVDDELKDFPFDSIAELHLAEQDPWLSYLRELKEITEGGIGRLYRIETTAGIIATGNSIDFDAMGHSLNGDRSRLLVSIERLTKTRDSLLARGEKNKVTYLQRMEDSKRKDEQAKVKYQDGLKKINESTRLTERERSLKLRSLKDSTIGREQERQARSVDRLKKNLERSAENAKRQLGFLDQQLKKNRDALRAFDPNGNPDNWYHKVHPAWSLDEMWLPFAEIRTSLWFDTHEVPLSRLSPTLINGTRKLAHGFHVALDRSVTDEALQTDEVEFGWGVGVHGDSQLVIEIPRFATAFRSRLGLSESVGDGGCVQAQIHVNSVGKKPLYTSPTLVGGKQLIDTDWIDLPENGAVEKLILQVIANPTDRPSTADPLDIRDQFNWLEPAISLDIEQLEQHIQLLSQ
jgi:hypothetical protein